MASIKPKNSPWRREEGNKGRASKERDCNTMKLNELFKKHKELEDEQLRVERFRDILRKSPRANLLQLTMQLQGASLGDRGNKEIKDVIVYLRSIF